MNSNCPQNRHHGWVAVVDDDQAFRESLAELLGWIGFVARTFDDAESCMAALDASVRLVVLDVQLPGLSGAEAVQALLRAKPDVPVVSVSGRASNGTRSEVLAAGAREFLEKPFPLEALRAYLAE